jgi:hypothetical protein
MIYLQVQKAMVGQTHRENGDLISLYFSFRKERRLKQYRQSHDGFNNTKAYIRTQDSYRLCMNFLKTVPDFVVMRFQTLLPLKALFIWI